MADTFAGLLRRNAADPDRIFTILPEGDTITYAEQFARSPGVAASLRRLGAQPGDRIHAQLPNCPEFFDIWFATALSGTVLVPTNPQSFADELRHILDDAIPVVSIRGAAEVAEMRSGTRTTPRDDTGEEPGRVAAILCTSGTTSRAKGVVVTDTNCVAVGNAVAEQLAVTAADRCLVVLPLFHANAQYYCTMSALVRGASLALPPRFSAGGWARQARTTGATLASLFAALVRMILAGSAQPLDGHNRLRAVLFAQNLTATDAATFERRFGIRLVQLYGMTETVLPPTMNPVDENRRWDSIGRPLPGVTVDLVDRTGTVVDSPGTGEMRIAGRPGETLAAGYWHDLQATEETFTDQGLRTGDLARRDSDGFLYFVDRAKEMIKRSGENVSAGEIERVAGEHPAAAECAAIGVADPIRDEAIVLVAVVRSGHGLTTSDLLGWCAERLSAFKVPSFVVLVGSLPRTSVGKVHTAELSTRSEIRTLGSQPHVTRSPTAAGLADCPKGKSTTDGIVT
ncbi:class I adenylate-forming enzyme family protein [Streptomyces sp. NPDC087845]|uniref:class I adenylate-forming enzyme family protein n=1 Tax=Streptomyces sp. NPDC087845 TaxID=3365806 RepID=UPI00380540CF